MASCDFSLHNYSYDDVVGDMNLTNFNLTIEDFVYKVSAKSLLLKEFYLIENL